MSPLRANPDSKKPYPALLRGKENGGIESRRNLLNTMSSYESFASAPETVSLPETAATTPIGSPKVSCVFDDCVYDTPASEPEKDLPLPPKVLPKPLRNARLIWLNVYRRLFAVVFGINLITYFILLGKSNNWGNQPSLSAMSTATAINVLVAGLFRTDFVINAVFQLCLQAPLWLPLRLRCMLAKCYEFGGIHSGAGVSAMMWFLFFTMVLTRNAIANVSRDAVSLVFSWALVSLLVLIVICAFPTFRFKSHNAFEISHRFAGWFAIVLFWVLVIVAARVEMVPGSDSLGTVILRTPSFWILIIITGLTIYPWLRLRKLEIFPEQLSEHAVRLNFKEPIHLFRGLKISDKPWTEWHSFACIPSRDGGLSGGSMLVSNAGDWTKKTIRNPQSFYFTRGVPVLGVLCMAKIFRRVVIVTTGSGIGPCLGVMQDIPDTFCRVIWSAPRPLATFGSPIMEMIKAVDRNALIIDSKLAKERANLPLLAYNMYIKEKAECVFIISNPATTKQLIYAMESRGIPCFGPIWDS